jgi:hypothetical protein
VIIQEAFYSKMLTSVVAIGLLFCLLEVNGNLYVPQTINEGGFWNDFYFCDNDQWAFDNPNPAVHARHRNGNMELTEGFCFYGEWTGENGGVGDYSGTNDNLWAASQWYAYAEDGVTLLTDFDILISFRLWGFCDYEPNDDIYVLLKDNFVSEGPSPDSLADDVWGRQREIVRMTKNRNNCDGWTAELIGLNEPNWLSEVACADGNNGVSCYFDYEGIWRVNSSRFGLRFQADLNNGWLNEAWAFGAIQMEINPPLSTFEPPTPCCTGTRTDHPNKSCGAFHEQRNCRAKGCTWNSGNEECEITCCRFEHKQIVNKEKPQCKDYNFAPNICDTVSCLKRDECALSKCDIIGMGDNTDGIPGNGK